MKHHHFSFVICTCALVVLLASCTGNKVWERPDVLYSNSPLAVNGVERQADRTVLHLSIEGRPGNNFRIQSTTYLAGDNGKEYALTGSEGLILDQWTPFSEEVKSFDLYFEPVKGREQALDLIEPQGWMIYGIHDADKPLRIRPAKEQGAIKDENEFFKKGTGTLSGRFEGSDRYTDRLRRPGPLPSRVFITEDRRNQSFPSHTDRRNSDLRQGIPGRTVPQKALMP